jgi:uncharacterized protein (DUF58 family)
MANRPAQYIDPAVLAKVENYAFLARTIVEGFVAGLHRSLYHGFGSEFVQYRNYSEGDDLKYVDWKVFARHDKYQMKVFQEETNTNCYIVLDASASMEYTGTHGISKLHYAKIIAACIAYLVNRQGDNVGFYAYSDKVHTGVPPGHRSGQVHQICTELSRLKAGGGCDHAVVLNYLGESFNRRGIVVMISDFLDTDTDMLKSLRHFRFAHHDCILFQVLDDDELDFGFTSTMRFVDSETGAEIITSPGVVRREYLERFGRELEELQLFCSRSNIDYHQLRSSQPLASSLAAYLNRREKFR